MMSNEIFAMERIHGLHCREAWIELCKEADCYPYCEPCALIGVIKPEGHDCVGRE